MKKRIIIVGNGTLSEKFLTYIKPTDYIVGVDRAAYWLIRHGVVPQVAIGDFDSTSTEEFAVIKKSIARVSQFKAEKDWTDMELAINHAIRQHPSEVIIFGGTGTRLDHTVGTWHALDKFLTKKIPHVLMDETNRVRLIGRGRTILKRGGYTYASFLPYTKSVTLTLYGYKYNVSKSTLVQGATIGISNEIISPEATIDVFAGKTWVVESND